MLDTFRKHSNSSLIYLIFGALIFVFAVSFGPGSQGCKTSSSISGSVDYAAKVNDDLVTVRDFNRTYSRVYADYQERGGGAFTPELADQMGLKKMVLEKLVERNLLAQEAERRGLAVGDRELAKRIADIKGFWKNGAFDPEEYRLRVERELNSTVPKFEQEMRRDILSQKMLDMVEGSANISDAELHAAYVKEHDTANVTFVRFAPSAFATEVQSTASDAAVEKFMADHAQAITDFYAHNTYRYHKPQRFQLKHILIKSPEGAAAADEQAAKDKAEKAEAALKSGKSFDEVAKEFSEDANTKDRGGELGTMSPGSMDKKLEEAVSKLTEGQVSEPIRTHFGYQIAQLEKILPPEEKKLDDVKKDIAAELIRNDAAKQLAQQKATEAEQAIQSGRKLDDLYPAEEKKDTANGFDFAAASRVQSAETGPFSQQGEFVPKIGPAPEIAAAAFSLSDEKPVGPKVFELNNAYYVIQLKEREKPDEKAFEEQKDTLRESLLSQKRNAVASDYLRELKASAKIEENQSLTMPSAGRNSAPEGA